MSPTSQAKVGRFGGPLPGAGTGGPGWLRVGVLIAILGLAFVAAQTCQKSQIRLTKDEAIVKAERQVRWEPTRTQIRLLRQGLSSKPYWIVSMSIPGKIEGTFRRLTVVRINANTGKVETVERGHAPR